ncbi:MAG: proteasome subunit beta [Nitrospirota bacterium]
MSFLSDSYNSSFYEYLSSYYKDMQSAFMQGKRTIVEREISQMIPHGTTVLSLKYKDGVVISGDRRATEGHQISSRRIEKVYQTDKHSAIAIAGAAGPCIEIARLFRIELEHYEKLEGTALSTEGKANKLAQMIKGNLPLAMQGLLVLPIFAGYDLKQGKGRIFKYDITGGRYEEIEFHSIGSGGKDARNTLKKLYSKEMDENKAIDLALEAIFDAADEDIGTGGPDLIRDIFPTVKIVTREGIADIEKERIKDIYNELFDRRRRRE